MAPGAFRNLARTEKTQLARSVLYRSYTVSVNIKKLRDMSIKISVYNFEPADL